MKIKIKLPLIIICNVILFAIFAYGFYLETKVEIPDIIDKNEFISYVERMGCDVVDLQAKEQYSGVDIYLTTDPKSCPYLVSYVVFNNKERRNDFFIGGKNNVLNGNSGFVFKTNFSINFYNEYYEHTSSGDYYKKIALNKNSILYGSASKEYKEGIINIFKNFNYKHIRNSKGFEISQIAFLILFLIYLISFWIIEKKIRNKGWVAIFPFYNFFCLSNDVLGSPWYAFLLCFPITTIIFLYLVFYYLGRVFNKSKVQCILLAFFPTILFSLIAFSNLEYDSTKVMKIRK